jgi:hypothetical protein
MDKTEIIKIAITVAITVCVKEVLTLVAKQSKTVATILARTTTRFLSKHWRGLGALIDLTFCILCIVLIVGSLGKNDIPATQSFAALMAFCSFFGILSLINFQSGLTRYLDSIFPKKKTEPNKALEPTRMLVTDRAAHAPRQASVRLI